VGIVARAVLRVFETLGCNPLNWTWAHVINFVALEIGHRIVH
jgi:hypothetical protein